MDYKEYIAELRKAAGFFEVVYPDFLDVISQYKKCADAIETLLEDRDEMIKDLRHGGCKVCIFSTFAYSDEPCCKCKETGSTTDKWEWRGVTKEKEE